jgi:hypothetical protein
VLAFRVNEVLAVREAKDRQPIIASVDTHGIQIFRLSDKCTGELQPMLSFSR